MVALQQPGTAAFSGWGALARLPQGMVGLGTVLLLLGRHRSFTLAGVIVGVIAIGQAVTSPPISRLIDRVGQRHVLAPQLLAHLTGLALFVAAAEHQSPPWVLLILGAGIGTSLPQFGPCSRARWTALLADDPLLDTALSIESLIDEAVFVAGPILVVTLATTIDPRAGLLSAMGLVLVGGLLFLGQRGTEPTPSRTYAAVAEHPRALGNRGLLVIAGVFCAVGVLFGLIEVGIVALTREHRHPAMAGTMLALWATGSLLCGVAYGAIRWQTPAVRRFMWCTAAISAGSLVVAASSGSLFTTTVALFAAGLANAPTLITGNTLVPTVVPPGSVTEAYTWLAVTVFAGIAIGSPVAGALVDRWGAAAALWAGLGAGGVAAALALAGRESLADADRQPP